MAQPSGSTSRIVATNSADQQADGAPVARHVRGRRPPPRRPRHRSARDRDRQDDRQHEQDDADDDREELRPNGIHLGEAARRASPRRRSGTRRPPRARRRRGTAPCRPLLADRRLACGSSVVVIAAPARSASTRPGCPGPSGTVRTRAPVTNASVQPFFTSASFHCCVPCSSSSTFTIACLGIVGNARRRKDSAPVGECQVDARLFQRRGVDALDPLVAGHREHPQLAGLDLVDELAGTRRADGDLLAEQRGQQVAAAVIGDEVDLLRVDADGLAPVPSETGGRGRRVTNRRRSSPWRDRPSTPRRSPARS